MKKFTKKELEEQLFKIDPEYDDPKDCNFTLEDLLNWACWKLGDKGEISHITNGAEYSIFVWPMTK